MDPTPGHCLRAKGGVQLIGWKFWACWTKAGGPPGQCFLPIDHFCPIFCTPTAKNRPEPPSDHPELPRQESNKTHQWGGGGPRLEKGLLQTRVPFSFPNCTESFSSNSQRTIELPSQRDRQNGSSKAQKKEPWTACPVSFQINICSSVKFLLTVIGKHMSLFPPIKKMDPPNPAVCAFCWTTFVPSWVPEIQKSSHINGALGGGGCSSPLAVSARCCLRGAAAVSSSSSDSSVSEVRLLLVEEDEDESGPESEEDPRRDGDVGLGVGKNHQ